MGGEERGVPRQGYKGVGPPRQGLHSHEDTWRVAEACGYIDVGGEPAEEARRGRHRPLPDTLACLLAQHTHLRDHENPGGAGKQGPSEVHWPDLLTALKGWGSPGRFIGALGPAFSGPSGGGHGATRASTAGHPPPQGGPTTYTSIFLNFSHPSPKGRGFRLFVISRFSSSTTPERVSPAPT
jgi:hypothetical protein